MMKKIFLLLFVMSISIAVHAQENCNNAIDDDSDGLIDMNDPDCACNGFGSTGVTSLIPNPSFEDFSCCPTAVSQLNCADSWIQASYPTTDYYNLCGFTSISGIPPPDLPLPGAPGGAGYAGFHSNPGWEEYIGACLTVSMTAGTNYTLDFYLAWSYGSQTFNAKLYGTPNCGELPWTNYTCPIGSGNWMELGTTIVTFPANQSWQHVTINFTPAVNIDAVAIGGPCGGLGNSYYFIDELTLATTASFSSELITESGSWCDNDLILTATTSSTTAGSWQWFEDGIALVGETNSVLDMMVYGAGNYTAVYTVAGDCGSADYTLTVPPIPVSAFTTANQCDGTPIDFTDNSTIAAPGNIVNWAWDFGDGNTSNAQHPSHTYASDGTYNVSLAVTDNNGCTKTSTQTVMVHPNPVAAFTVPDGCVGIDAVFTNTSSISSGNISSWAWDFGDGNTSTLQDPTHAYASSGTYNVSLIALSDQGCSSTVSDNTTVLDSSDPSWTNPDTICESGGIIDLTTLITGTVGGSWSGTGVSGTNFDPSGLSGPPIVISYTVGTVPCDSTLQQNITVMGVVDPSWVAPTGLCSFSPLFDLNSAVTGTTGGTWSGTGVSGSDFDPASGTQTITYTVGSGSCQEQLPLTITVGIGENPAWTTLTMCASDAPIDLNGTITGDTGGTWSGTGIAASVFDPSFGTQLITYTVGPLGCETTNTQTITVINPQNPTITPAGPLCHADPSVLLTASHPGGVWSGTGITNPTTGEFDPSVAGIGAHSITYEIPSICSNPVSDNITITVLDSSDPSWTNPDTICESGGTINLATLITGTTGGTWSGTGVSGTNFDPTGLSGPPIAISYTVGTVPCDSTLQQNITVMGVVDPSWVAPTGLCSFSPLFDLNSAVTGTTGGTWSGTGVSGSDFDPASGTQTITYTVGSGSCQEQLPLTITVGIGENPAWTTLTMCASDAPIDLNGTITGDTGGTWSGTGIATSVFDPSFGTQLITYTVGPLGCETTNTQTITVIDPQVTITETPISCFGLLDGSAIANVTGGSGSETYSWSTVPIQTTANATNLDQGTYTVTVTDGPCTITGDATIQSPPEITASLSGINACQMELGSASIVVTGGVGGYTYSWNNTTQTTATVTDLDSAMHTVTVTDGNGCTYVDSILVQVFAAPMVTTISDSLISHSSCIILQTEGASSYSWTPSIELDCADCPAPEACPLSLTTYCVTGTDNNGCTGSDCVTIDVEIICGDVFVPSAFSPNNDGENDLLCVYSDCMEYLSFAIYNRWGEKVYEASDMTICWDGSWKGKELNSAVFVYTLEGTLVNGNQITQKGNISLVR